MAHPSDDEHVDFADLVQPAHEIAVRLMEARRHGRNTAYGEQVVIATDWARGDPHRVAALLDRFTDMAHIAITVRGEHEIAALERELGTRGRDA